MTAGLLGGAVLGAVAPFLNGGLIAPERKRQDLVRIGKALKALDRDEPVDAVQQRAQVGGDAEIGIATTLGRQYFKITVIMSSVPSSR